MNTPQFDHEKLNVYHEALQFVAMLTELLDKIPKRFAVHGQLDRSLNCNSAQHSRGQREMDFTGPVSLF